MPIYHELKSCLFAGMDTLLMSGCLCRIICILHFFRHWMINEPAISFRIGIFSMTDVSCPATPKSDSGIRGCIKSKGTMEIFVKPWLRSFLAIPHRKKAVSSGESPALRLRAGMFLINAICGFIILGSVNMMPPPGFKILENSFKAASTSRWWREELPTMKS